MGVTKIKRGGGGRGRNEISITYIKLSVVISERSS